MGKRKHSTDLSLVQRYSHLSASHKARRIETIADRSTTRFTTVLFQEMSSTLQSGR